MTDRHGGRSGDTETVTASSPLPASPFHLRLVDDGDAEFDLDVPGVD
ncbi:hypothetical protein [Microbispora bryophytorum]